MNELQQSIQAHILGLIPKEKSHAINLKDLCGFTGMKPREVKAVITDLRLEYPICAKETDGGGYWLAESNDDIKDFVSMIERRRLGYERTIKVMMDHSVPENF